MTEPLNVELRKTKDEVGLVESSKKEIDFAFARFDHTRKLLDLVDSGHLPLRITHNDTKFNNVLIDDRDGTGVCVIDLDTVMPGLSLYDFGDSIRSMANPAAEDEQDLSKVNFDLKVFIVTACAFPLSSVHETVILILRTSPVVFISTSLENFGKSWIVPLASS